jgi:tRNA A-37 threonylcarbamoyl transferase component Bud32
LREETAERREEPPVAAAGAHGAEDLLESYLCARDEGEPALELGEFLRRRALALSTSEARVLAQRLAAYERLERSLGPAEASPPLAPGQRLGRYRVLALAGRGGMGEVYRARDERLGREVALKLIAPERAREPRTRRRFEREARSAGALSHPHLVTVFDLEEADGRLFLVMEFVPGCTLRDLRAEEHPSAAERVRFVAAVARAIACAHRAGIVHRDLKPENLMITPSGAPKVLDFGLAKPLAEDGVGATSHTGQVLGTSWYMSPEQVRGRELTPASDQFSLAIVLFEWLSGRRPFGGEGAYEIAEAIVKHPPRRLELAEPWAGEIERVLLRALEKVPERRYADAEAFADDLERALEGREARGGRAPRADAAAWRRAVLGAVLLAALLAAWKIVSDALRPDAREATRGIPAIAVLPCVSADPGAASQRWDGFVESAVVRELERIAESHGLRVVAPDLLRAQAQRSDRLEHAYVLGGALAVEPSVRCSGERMIVELGLVPLAGARETLSRVASDGHEVRGDPYATSGHAVRQALGRLALEAQLSRRGS